MKRRNEMRKKEPWMRVGTIVSAFTKQGTILSMEENIIDGIQYVYYITVRTNKGIFRYHPDEVEPRHWENDQNQE